MTLTKRLFDVVVALIVALVLAPVVLIVAVLILATDGLPVFYVSERMKGPKTSFQLVKFRSMTVVAQDSGVSGGDKTARITRIGRFLRRSRLDEVPQLWNILKGDMSFVGPRPPLRQYVEAFPALYTAVLQSRPGVTGLATLLFHAHEDHLLRRSRSAAETDAIYRRACVPRKARLDLIYQAKRSLCFDIILMIRTVWR